MKAANAARPKYTRNVHFESIDFPQAAEQRSNAVQAACSAGMLPPPFCRDRAALLPESSRAFCDATGAHEITAPILVVSEGATEARFAASATKWPARDLANSVLNGAQVVLS